MSPEQCRGSGEVDHRADIYSLGCMMFRCLTGRLPFEAQGSGELIMMHLLRVAASAESVPADSPRARRDRAALHGEASRRSVPVDARARDRGRSAASYDHHTARHQSPRRAHAASAAAGGIDRSEILPAPTTLSSVASRGHVECGETAVAFMIFRVSALAVAACGIAAIVGITDRHAPPSPTVVAPVTSPASAAATPPPPPSPPPAPVPVQVAAPPLDAAPAPALGSDSPKVPAKPRKSPKTPATNDLYDDR